MTLELYLSLGRDCMELDGLMEEVDDEYMPSKSAGCGAAVPSLMHSYA